MSACIYVCMYNVCMSARAYVCLSIWQSTSTWVALSVWQSVCWCVGPRASVHRRKRPMKCMCTQYICCITCVLCGTNVIVCVGGGCSASPQLQETGYFYEDILLFASGGFLLVSTENLAQQTNYFATYFWSAFRKMSDELLKIRGKY